MSEPRIPKACRPRTTMVKALYRLVENDRYLSMTEFEIFAEIMKTTGGNVNPVLAKEEAHRLFSED